jgi:hypothetical protein
MTVKAGDRLVGLRVSTPELAEVARQVLAPSLVDGVTAPPNVSVLATDAHAGRRLLVCYRSGSVVTRSRSEHRAVESALVLLSSYGSPGSGDLVRVPAVVAVRDGRAVLLTPQARIALDALAPRLRQAGWALADSVTADIHPGTGMVVITGPTFAVDADALSRLPRDRADGPPAPPGRYPVAAWVDLTGDREEPSSPAARVAVVAALAEDLDGGNASAVLGAVTAMLDGAVWVTSPTVDAAQLAAAVATAASVAHPPVI